MNYSCSLSSKSFEDSMADLAQQVNIATGTKPSFGVSRNKNNDAWRDIKRIQIEGEKRIRHFRKSCEILRSFRSRKIEENRSRANWFDARVMGTVECIKMKNIRNERLLRLNYQTGIKRFQQLVFECAGETEKVLAQLDNLMKNENIDYKLKRKNVQDSLVWELFFERIREEGQGDITLKNLSFKEKNLLLRHIQENENEALEYKYDRMAFLYFELARPSAVPKQPAKLTNRSSFSASRPLKNDGTNIKKIIAETACKCTERDFIHSDFRRSKVIEPLPLYDTNTLLSVQPICWLLWPQLGIVPSRCHVYFCLEERCCSLKHPFYRKHSAITEFLAEIYSSKDTTGFAIDDLKRLTESRTQKIGSQLSRNKWPTGFTVYRKYGNHRDDASVLQLEEPELRRRVAAYPDVLLAGTFQERKQTANCSNNPSCNVKIDDDEASNMPQSLYHFVPATVNHLLESSRFFQLFSSSEFSADESLSLRKKYGDEVKYNAISTLYAVLPSEADSVVHEGTMPDNNSGPQKLDCTQVVPIPEEAIDELIRCYILRSRVAKSAESVLENSSQYTVRVFQSNLKCDALGRNCDLTCQANKLSFNPPSCKLVSKNLMAKVAEKKHQKEKNATSKTVLPKELYHHAVVAAASRLTLIGSAEEESITDSPICKWRACNADVRDTKREILCEFHFQCYERLRDESVDLKNYVTNERLNPKESCRWVSSLLKTSPLVSELLSSKLIANVKEFGNRLTNPERQREFPNQQRNRNNANMADSPENRICAIKKYKRFLKAEIVLAQKIDAAERQVVHELLRYVKIRVFPSDPLDSIRREFKLLINDQDSHRCHSRTSDLDMRFHELVLRNSKLPNGEDSSSNENSNNGDSIDVAKVCQEGNTVEAELELDFSLRKIDILRRCLAIYQTNDMPCFDHIECRPANVAASKRRQE